MSSGDLFVNVVTFLFDDMKSISCGNSEENIKKVLFLDVLNGLIFLTVNLRDDFFNAADTVPTLPALRSHLFLKRC